MAGGSPRIGVASIVQETNTFSRAPTRVAHFRADGLWVGDGLVASARTAIAAAPLGRVTSAVVAVVAVLSTVAVARAVVRDLRRDQPGSVSA